MVNPIYLFVTALGGAFLIGPADRLGRRFSFWLTASIMTVMAWIAGTWFYALSSGSSEMQVFTAGLRPPFSIYLTMGYKEAVILHCRS